MAGCWTTVSAASAAPLGCEAALSPESYIEESLAASKEDGDACACDGELSTNAN